MTTTKADEKKPAIRIFKTRWFQRFARKNEISDDSLRAAVAKAEKGLIDADLGGGVIKQRIAKAGQGSSTGYRTVILYRKGDKAFFEFAFEKSQKDNLSKDEEKQYKEGAKHYLALTDKQLSELVKNGDLMEVKQ